ncbi:MAG: adenylate/guanylate cyclase domain-containing protein, partial [Gaiellaceae bacterium]
AAFQRAGDAVRAAIAGQRALGDHAWPEGAILRVRMGLHTGEPAVEGGAYLGLDVNRAARICAAAHGGQVLLSQTTRELVTRGVQTEDLGRFSLAGLTEPEHLFQLVVPGMASRFPSPRIDAPHERRSLARSLKSSRWRRPSLEEGAFAVRALLSGVEPGLQRPLSALGATLFTAHRAAAGADEFLARIDGKRMLPTLQTAEATDNLRSSVETLTHELDQTVTQAAAAVDPLSFKLGRTRRRGVYRSGRLFVVPFFESSAPSADASS